MMQTRVNWAYKTVMSQVEVGEDKNAVDLSPEDKY